MNIEENYIQSLRYFSEYTQRHRGRKFVIHLSDSCIVHEQFPQVLDDILFLYHQGIQLILSYGAKSQIDRYLAEGGINCDYANGERITNNTVLPVVQHVCGEIENLISARFARSNRESLSEHHARIIRGNFVLAKPKGVIDGIDFRHTGAVRRVDRHALQSQISNQNIVLLSPVAFSPSGEIFNIRSLEVSAEVARSIQADKFIYLGEEEGIRDRDGKKLNEIVIGEFDAVNVEKDELLELAEWMCRSGIQRFHYASYKLNGALLKELFTRVGSGTQVVLKSYQQTVAATVNDIAHIIDLVEPLEQQGLLVKRSRDLLELEIDKFIVVKVDGMVVACSALYPLSDTAGELACVATAAEHQGYGLADLLLSKIEGIARSKGFTQLFVLTTHAKDWFGERGFLEVEPEELPEGRRQVYNYKRNSKVLKKSLL